MYMNTKRTWDEMEESDEDEPSMGRQILPVAQLPDDFDGEPMDGMQYLFTVRYIQANHHPSSKELSSCLSVDGMHVNCRP